MSGIGGVMLMRLKALLLMHQYVALFRFISCFLGRDFHDLKNIKIKIL
jgi:hypothetical protein